MRRRWLYALVLGALLARLVLPLVHVHDDGGPRGREAAQRTSGPVIENARPECGICVLLAVKVPGLTPRAPTVVEKSEPLPRESWPIYLATPRSAAFSFVGAPRGPPASSPA
jgi:hypothetical protein